MRKTSKAVFLKIVSAEAEAEAEGSFVILVQYLRGAGIESRSYVCK